MQRKEFVLIADIIKHDLRGMSAKDQRFIACQFAARFNEAYPRFNLDMFLNACDNTAKQ
jgi:hypothetical protein